ncbi:branched-chain amino acid transport system II carrier protein [Halomonas sp. YLGW01]|uniref:branched-chain amino acid transport system II carrier protein n=1 Tax=Halomonas sp. YLGW01 TaxID=2773308 RepID=UPI00192DD3B1|nr:branched-chain amino acid transport system II carrier protein [Halomonas sp. YLGW01]
MTTRLSGFEVLALGFMTFALFLGAGNIIFPPQVGQGAGMAFWPAALGFLATGVGLPLLGIVAVAMVGGGLDRLTSPLPKAAAMLFGLGIYLSIGPLFALPRTGTVAFEMGMRPFIELTEGTGLALHSVLFFGLATLLALSPGRLVDVIGKWITPLLIFLLMVIAAATLLFPQGPLGPVSEAWVEAPFAQGFENGYLTMDTLASLVFGILIVSAIRERGIEDRAALMRYTLLTGVIAATCLAAVYLPLAYMGATSHEVAAGADNGALIPTYVQALFGPTGPVLLAVIITLACLTTAVGLLTACGEYFHRLFPRLPYRWMVIIMGAFSALVANQGLDSLIRVSVPVLVALYPPAIALIALSMLRRRLADAPRVFSCTLGLTFAASLLDGLAASGVEALVAPASALQALLPLGATSFGWLLPAAAGLLLGLAISRRSEASLDPALAD